MTYSRKELADLSRVLREEILVMTNRVNNGHVGGSLSEADILTALYFDVMNIRPDEPEWSERDRFILSKGHSTPGYYAVLSKRGYFPGELLETFDQTDTKLQAHPDMHKCPGVDFSTGSLGQGLSIGIGIASGAGLLNKNFRTFVLLGDGESQEGQVWEALMYGGAMHVKHLIAIFDYNKVQLSCTMADSVNIAPLTEKLQAFNWQVIETDGHDMEALVPALQKAAALSDLGPVAVVANTVKGKGVSFMENDYHWHGKAPNDQELQQALAELRCEKA